VIFLGLLTATNAKKKKQKSVEGQQGNKQPAQIVVSRFS